MKLATMKIYAKCLRPDIEYKTLSISYQTTCRELIHTLLSKYKMKHRDPNLFYLTMEVLIRKTGVPIRTLMVLDDEACPAELQSCHPRGESKFALQMRRGGLVKVHDACLMPGSQYKSLLISEKTTVDELIQLLLNCYNIKEPLSRFSIHEAMQNRGLERKLHPDDCPLSVVQNCPEPRTTALVIRRNPEPPPRRKLLWSKSLELSMSRSSDRSETSSPSSPVKTPSSYRNYENYFYI
ncbi:unnamed protein product [Darwinula stevensoni]|uniref:Ras-associating domain-containing protein n=1 Tax=Darwinula stevensoni TaxID=69355 RepID=A0A7R9A4N7_9CRUS|nr:unnamed protein product [Darwinula stevensoni]CAG0884650.1 unnamed protein product [Darwinula stevensoni]